MIPLWLAVGGGWLLLATAVGLILGRVVRNRDRQAPQPRKHPQPWPLGRHYRSKRK